VLVRVGALGGFALLVATAVLGYRRYHEPPERKELVGYFQTTFPQLHAQTRSVQSALAGLVDVEGGSGAPPPEPGLAVDLLDENILPSIDFVLEQARGVSLASIDARALHAGYVQALEAMRADAAAVRAAFADPALAPGEKRRRAAAIIARVGARFDAFYARAVAVWRENGIRVVTPAAPGPSREPRR
jgi:hypothetical protein